MAFSNSLYASQTICPLVTWSPTAVMALSKMDLALSIPPGKPMPPIEYWAYSSQISGPEMEKKKPHNSKNKWAAYQTNLETVACALTDIILHSPFKKLIEFLPIWLLQTDFILEPIQPYFCRMWQNGVTDKLLFVKNFTIHTLTFSEWEKFAHPLPGLTQREKLPLLLQ